MGYKINVSDLHYALVTKDDKTGIENGAIKSLPDVLKSITVAPNIITGENKGDGVTVDSVSYIDKVVVTIESTKIPAEDRAIILGNTYDKGTIEEGTDDSAPYIAMGWKAPYSNKTDAEYVWMYKGKAEPMEDGYAQKETSVEYQSEKIVITFIPRKNNGKINKKAYSDATDFVADTATNWFTTIPDSTTV